MINIKIIKKCNACGLCTIGNDYFGENDEGYPTLNSSKISSKDIGKIKEIASKCPQQAIQVTESKSTEKKGIEGIKELVNKLQKELDEFPEMKKPSTNDYKFVKNDYSVECPDARGEREYKYSSYESAMRAGKDEFNRIMYSQVDVLMLKVFMEYKAKCLRKYYDVKDETRCFYSNNNKKLEEILTRNISEMIELSCGKLDLPEDIMKVRIFPNKDTIKWCENNELLGEDKLSDVKHEFQKYGSLSNYASDIDTDSREEYVGSGFLGDKYKEKWCYYRVFDAEKSLAIDILDSFVCTIEDSVEPTIESLISSYNLNVREMIKDKMKIINSTFPADISK